jgi:hypothetical protein
MVQLLKVSLRLRWVAGDDYLARVTTQVTDSCYKVGKIKLGLPPGVMGMPEYDYITLELTHAGQHCAPIVTDSVQEIGGVKASTGKIGVTAFVLVNGEIAGSEHQAFPKRKSEAASFPMVFDFAAGEAATHELPTLMTAGAACHDFNLLKIKGWPEFKTMMEKQCKTVVGHEICVNVPVLYMRDCEADLVATVCHPNLAEILGDLEACLQQAAIAGVVAGLLTENPAAAAAALTGYLKSCLLAKGVQRASEVTASVQLNSQSCSDWHRRT